MERQHKSLPPGARLYVKWLPLGTTREELAHYFQSCGVPITAEHIAIKENACLGSAFVSIPDDAVVALVHALMEDKFRGKHVLRVEKKRKSYEFAAVTAA